MTQSKWEKIISILLGAILAILAVSGWVIVPAIMEQPEARVREKISIDARDDAYLYNGADLYLYSDDHGSQIWHADGETGNTDIEGTVDIASTLGVIGVATFGNDVIVDDTFNIDDTDSALVGTQTITPTATFYEFAPATTLTLTLATGSATVGDLLILQNTVSTSTVIVDTGATAGGGNVSLGLNDLALFIYSNSKWVEIASGDNS